MVFVPIGAATGLHHVHPTWAGTFVLDACVFLMPNKHFALIDRNCIPVIFFEIEELWNFSNYEPENKEPSFPDNDCIEVEKDKSKPSMPGGPKRSRLVDRGRDNHAGASQNVLLT